MGTFGWQSPFPLRLGGNAHKSVQDAYESINSNIGTALSTEDMSATDAENKAFARALGSADRAIERFANQSNPAKLTNMLERWESILVLRPSVNDTPYSRRHRVAACLLSNYNAGIDGLSRIAGESFAPWKTRLQFTSIEDAQVYWPGGTPNATYPWYSTAARIVVEFIRPKNSSDAERDLRVDACKAVLDEYAAAWATFDTSETAADVDSYGFTLDYPNLDVSCFGA